jgi:uncharacterized membrane protein YgdD (TMEM256/DUF423 family)
MRLWLFLAGLNGLVAVAAGAWGWHGMVGERANYKDIFNVGVDYQMWHALALLGVAWLAARGGTPRLIAAAGWAFVLGVALFSGTLYWMGLTGRLWLPFAAPVGGGFLMIGWAALMAAAVRFR